MALVARVSPATVPAITEGQETKGFYVLQVTLKQRDYDAKNILLLQKFIPAQSEKPVEADHQFPVLLKNLSRNAVSDEP